MIGLSGSHRSGKSTLAKTYAEKYNIEFVQTSSSAVFAALGHDPQADYDFATRLWLQEHVLDSALEVYKNGSNDGITDRTPIDMLAYLLADVQRDNLSVADNLMLMRYASRCYETIHKHFSVIISVQPGIAIVNDTMKAPATYGYMEHIAALIRGIVASGNVNIPCYSINKNIINLEQRIAAVDKAVNRAWEHSYSDIAHVTMQ